MFPIHLGRSGHDPLWPCSSPFCGHAPSPDPLTELWGKWSYRATAGREKIQDQHHNLGPDPGRVMSMHLFQMYSWRRRISWRCTVDLLAANWTTHIAISWTEKSLINMCDPGKAVQQVEQGGKEAEEVATNTDLLTADLLTSLCFSVCQPGTSFYLYAFIYKPIIEQLIF